MAAITMADVESVTFVQTVERFVESSPWLTDAHLPQLKALYKLAQILDAGGKTQAALVSQFTLTQRTLMAKGDAGGGADPSMPPPLPGLGPEGWGAEAPDADDYGT